MQAALQVEKDQTEDMLKVFVRALQHHLVSQDEPSDSQLREALKQLKDVGKTAVVAAVLLGPLPGDEPLLVGVELLAQMVGMSLFPSAMQGIVSLKAMRGESITEAQGESLTHAQESVYRKWRRLHNMRTEVLKRFLRSPELQEVLKTSRNSRTKGIREGIRDAQRLLTLKSRPAENWTESDWNTARRQIRFIEALRQNPAPTLDELERPTKKLFTLKAWGHDPSVRGCVTEQDIFDSRSQSKELHRWIAATSGLAPYPLVEDSENLPPSFPQLIGVKESLSDTTLSWRADVDGRTWFVANDADMYIARKSLQETIDATGVYLT
jgi:hypothetical protein